MVYHIFTNWFVTLMCYIHFPSGLGSSLNRFNREFKDGMECKELVNIPNWTYGNSKDVTPDVWPWCSLRSVRSYYTTYNALNSDGRESIADLLQYHAQKNDSTSTEYNKNDILYGAATRGNLSALKYFVEDKALPVDENDTKLLLAAAFGGNVDLVKYLIYEKNLTKSGISLDGDTALHAAAFGGQLEAVRFLVDVLKYRVNIKNSIGETPAHVAAAVSLPVLRYLIEESGAELNSTDDFHNTLLHSAAYFGQFDVVKYLVEQKNFSLELKDNFGMTALHKAVRNGKLNIVEYLAKEKKADVNSKDIFSRNLLHQAVIGNNLNVLKFLIDDMGMLPVIDELNFFNRTVAMEAVKYGEFPIMKFLIEEKHADTSTMDEEGCNFLHIAAKENNLQIVKYLIEEKGFNTNTKNTQGRTAYDLAIMYGADTSLCEYLKMKMGETS